MPLHSCMGCLVSHLKNNSFHTHMYECTQMFGFNQVFQSNSNENRKLIFVNSLYVGGVTITGWMSKMVSNHTQFDLHWISYWRFCYVREMMSLSTVYLRTNWFPPQTRQKRNKPSYIQIYFHIAYTEEKFLPHHLLMQDFSLCFYIKKNNYKWKS